MALSRNEAIPLEPMKVSMKVDWETFPQYLDRLDSMPLGINFSHLFPISPVVAYVMGGLMMRRRSGFRTRRRCKRLCGCFMRPWMREP